MRMNFAVSTAFAAALLSAPAFAQDLSAVSTSVEAANAAGLAETITSSEGLTVFVPTNDAIAAGPQDAIQGLLGNQEELAKVVSYYAVSGKVMAADVIAMAEENDGTAEVETLNGAMLKIMVEDGTVMIEGQTGATATVVTPDVTIGNVVVHVVDGLVLPAAPM